MAETDKDDLISLIQDDEGKTEIPDELPLLPVRDVVIFTDMLLPLFIGREKSVTAMEAAVDNDKLLFLATQKDPTIENPDPDEIYLVGTVGRILRMLKLPDGRLKALVQGISKARIVKYTQKKNTYRVKIELIKEQAAGEMSLESEALMRNVREQCEKILSLRGEMTGEVGSILDNIEDPGKLADLVASNLRLKTEDAQILLELTDSIQRLNKINE